MRAAMKKPEPVWVLPKDEVAARRKIDTEATTRELRELTVHELEQHLLSDDDETRTDLHQVLEGPAK
jgi:hypothetical protein